MQDARGISTVTCMSSRRALAVVPLVVLVAALTACTESASIPPPEPTAATQPLFATDKEALEAATAAYEEYLAVSYRIASQPPFSLESLKPLTTDEYFAREAEFFESLESASWQVVGSPLVTSATLQQWYLDPDLGAVVAVYLCLDVSGARVLDTEGADVTPPERPNQTGLEVEFVEGPMGALLLNRSEAWSGDSVCS